MGSLRLEGRQSSRDRGEEAKMLRITLLFGLVAFAACENWPDLKTTWGLNPFGAAFASQPRTESDAASAGWQAIAHCDGKFLGHRYADPSDPSLVMIYDDAGYIAGVQSVLLESDVDMSYNDLTKQPVYVQDVWMGQTAWFTTAYFVDPLVICNGGRSPSDWESHGTGDRLLIQTGTTDNLVSIPLTQAEADMTSDWYDHFCCLVWEITTSNSIILPTRLATLCCPSRSFMIRELLLDLSGSTLPLCLGTSGSTLMPWLLLRLLTGRPRV